jgi:hypothetical protein
LHVRAGVSLPVIDRACEGRASFASATKIHLATGGEVSIASMTADDVPLELVPPSLGRGGGRR